MNTGLYFNIPIFILGEGEAKLYLFDENHESDTDSANISVYRSSNIEIGRLDNDEFTKYPNIEISPEEMILINDFISRKK